MGTPQIATASDLSNILPIMDAVYAIARDDSGINWAGETEWDLPAENAIVAVPHLAVPWPRFTEYLIGYESQGDSVSPGWQMQFRWEIDVYCLAPYGDTAADRATNKKTVTDAAIHLLQVFTRYENLNGTCDEVRLGKPQLAKVSRKDPNNPQVAAPGAPIWFAGILTISATEEINTDFTPLP